jgi:hypothetical protein
MISETKYSKNSPRTKRKKQQEFQVTPEKRFWQYLSPTNKFWVGFGLFLALIAAYYELKPRISVTPSRLMESNNPFSAPFIIKNEGHLPIHSVTFRIASLLMQPIEGGKVIIPNNTYAYKEYFLIPILESGESVTTGLPDYYSVFILKTKISYVDIDFVVIYRPDYWPLTVEKHFRFGLSKNPDSWMWLPRSMSK